MIKNEMLLQRVKALKLLGMTTHWDELPDSFSEMIEKIIAWEEIERVSRSLERRLQGARIGRFKPLSEFDWNWPKKCDQQAICELMDLEFIKNATNVIFCGPNGVGKSMIACNIANNAVIKGHTALFTTAGQMLNELASQDGDNALRRKIQSYERPDVLIIDEVGYLSYSNRHADLLFEIISRRYEKKPVIITTNKTFGEWNEIFPGAACCVSLIDRLVHKSEIIVIDAESYRLKEAREQSSKRNIARKSKRVEKVTNKNDEEITC